MANPVKPSDYCALRTGPNSSPCQVAQNTAKIAELLCTEHKWMWNEDGTPTEEFLDDMGVTGGGVSGLDAPSGVAATSDRPADVQVSWNSVAAATAYAVFRGVTSDTASMTMIAADRSASPYPDTTAVPGTVYFYAVKASNPTLISGFSNVASGKRTVTSGAEVFRYSDTTIPGQYIVKTGMTLMTAQLWGPGGNGAGNSTGGWIVATGPGLGGGGGGASGSYMKVTGVPVVAGDVFWLAPAAAGGQTFLYKTTVGNAVRANATGGPPGLGGSYSTHGQGGVHTASAGASNLGGTAVPTPGVDGSPGTDGTNPSGSLPVAGTGGAGGAAVIDGPESAGKGGDGGVQSGSVGAGGQIILTFS